MLLNEATKPCVAEAHAPEGTMQILVICLQEL